MLEGLYQVACKPSYWRGSYLVTEGHMILAFPPTFCFPQIFVFSGHDAETCALQIKAVIRV